MTLSIFVITDEPGQRAVRFEKGIFMPVYTALSAALEIPPRTIFALSAGVETGALILARINDHLIVGRWFPLVADGSWILQPGRIIRITGRAAVVILGVVAPFEPFAIDWAQSRMD